MILATLAVPAKLPRQVRPRRQPQLERERISDIIICEKSEKPSTHQNEEIEHCRTGELKELATSILRYQVAPAVLETEATGQVEDDDGPGEYTGDCELPC